MSSEVIFTAKIGLLQQLLYRTPGDLTEEQLMDIVAKVNKAVAQLQQH